MVYAMIAYLVKKREKKIVRFAGAILDRGTSCWGISQWSRWKMISRRRDMPDENKKRALKPTLSMLWWYAVRRSQDMIIISCGHRKSKGNRAECPACLTISIY